MAGVASLLIDDAALGASQLSGLGRSRNSGRRAGVRAGNTAARIASSAGLTASGAAPPQPAGPARPRAP
jgi:hypothetical protein